MGLASVICLIVCPLIALFLKLSVPWFTANLALILLALVVIATYLVTKIGMIIPENKFFLILGGILAFGLIPVYYLLIWALTPPVLLLWNGVIYPVFHFILSYL